jgi:hypothetical protein
MSQTILSSGLSEMVMGNATVHDFTTIPAGSRESREE